MNRDAFISPNKAAVVTISDLKDDYFEDCSLSEKQLQAIKVFDKYKVTRLSNASSDEDFQKEYFDLKVIENTMDYLAFLELVEKS